MAPPILSLDDVTLNQGGRPLFGGLTLHVGARDRLALVGRNGAGKSTLFRLMLGELEPDIGERRLMPGRRVAMLAQDPGLAGHATLGDWALAGDAPPAHRVEAVAHELALELALPAATASGGERRRAALARVLAEEADVLLLDEPTNHLDIAGIEWLEARLERHAGAFLAVSHDRAFLTRLTRSTLWLDRGRLRRREIGFGGFESWAEEVAAEEAKAAARADQKLAAELEWLARGVTARRKRNQGRLERLETLRAQRRSDIGPPGRSQLALEDARRRQKMVIEAEEASLAFGDRPIVRELTLGIQRGDRIGVVGPNGAGKTSLVRLLTGELAPTAGTVRVATGIEGITIDQQRRLMQPGRRVRDVLAEGGDWLDVRGHRTHARAYLKQFLFQPDDLDRPVESFSGGEQSRLLLAREFARTASLLVLDEPTNDLDVETLDLLQEVVADFEGTVIVVSHDRDFLDRTVTLTLGLDGSGRVEVVVGGHRELAARRRAAPAGPRAAAAPRAAPRLERPRAARLGFRDTHDLERLPAAIAAREQAIARLEAALADPALFGRDPKGFGRLSGELEAERAALAAEEERWLEAAERAEALDRRPRSYPGA